MTADEVRALIAVLDAAGVRTFRDGDVLIEFAERKNARGLIEKPRPLPEGAVLPE